MTSAATFAAAPASARSMPPRGLDSRSRNDRRAAAHRMSRRNESIDTIAGVLGVNRRTVFRYLNQDCPDGPTEREVELEDFYMWGSCYKNSDLDWFADTTAGRKEAQKVCETCPVLEGCRSYGLNKGLRETGLWGGLTQNQRIKESRRLKHEAARKRAAGRGKDRDAA